MDAKQPVVAYCRVSTLEQKRRGYGIDIQIREVERFATERGFLIDHIYKDEGQSGVLEHRRALRRLLRDCRAGRVGTLVLPALDRLSRNLRLAENLFYELERAGVRVLIADMPHYNGQDRRDVLIRQIREAIAEENRKEIIERLWRGRQERVRQGRPPGGNVPYGFRRAGKEWVTDPTEAAAVRVIFELAEQGLSGSSIAKELAVRGFTRRNGRPWTQRQVAAILRRLPLYERGLLRYGAIEREVQELALLA